MYTHSSVLLQYLTYHFPTYMIFKANDRGASLMCIVNPTNPTGDYWNINEIKAYIESSCEPETTVIVGRWPPAYLELLASPY